MKAKRVGKVTGIMVGLLALGGVVGPAASATSASPNMPQNWECPNGFSCYYDGQFGTDGLWIAPRCGWFDLRSMNPPLNDRFSSVRNLGPDDVNLYNWDNGWVVVTTVRPGATVQLAGAWDNIVDAVNIPCS